MNNKISVILPAYNCENYIEAAIESILNQTYKNFEIIIIYDVSSDQTLKKINFFKKNKKIKIVNGNSSGLIGALNLGLLHSSGEFIARMDADDISHMDRFKKQLNFMIENKLDLCGSHYDEINNIGGILRTKYVPISQWSIQHYLLFTIPFAHGSVMLRKAFLDANNLKYSSDVTHAEDYKLWVDCYSMGARFGNVNEILYQYRRLPNSAMNTAMRKNFIECRKIRKELILNHADDIYNVVKIQFDKYTTFNRQEKLYFILANYFLLIHKQKNLFFKLILKAELSNILVFMIYLILRT